MNIKTVPRKAGILSRFQSCSTGVRDYFNHFPNLAEEFPWDVSISYLFGLVELAHNMTIYCGVVKLHRVDATLARNAINNLHLTRKGFRDLYEKIFGKPLKRSVWQKMENAEKIRDKIQHGKDVSEEEKRKAVIAVIEYAEEFNDVVKQIGGFKPFGPLRGFRGRAKALDRSTSRWVLKGMNFSV